MGEAVRRWRSQATERVRFDTVVAGREFCAVEVVAGREFYAADAVAACEGQGVDYLMPGRENDRVGRFFGRMDEQVTVGHQSAMYGAVRGRVSNGRVVTTLVGLPAEGVRECPQAFVTNSDIDDEIGLIGDRRLVESSDTPGAAGSRRLTRTSRRSPPGRPSREVTVQSFQFGFVVLSYDLWVLVDFLVQVSLEIVEDRVRPRVMAGRYRALLGRRLGALVESLRTVSERTSGFALDRC